MCCTAAWNFAFWNFCDRANNFASVAASGVFPLERSTPLRAPAIWVYASASVSKSGLMSDGVLSANSFRICACFWTSPFAPLNAVENACPRSESCLQFAASAPRPAVVSDEVVVVVPAAAVVVSLAASWSSPRSRWSSWSIAAFFFPQPAAVEDQNEHEQDAENLG